MKTIPASVLQEFLNFRTLEYLRSKGLVPVTVENVGKVNNFIFNINGSSRKCIQLNTTRTGFSKILDGHIVKFTTDDSAQRDRYIVGVDGITSIFDESLHLIKQTDVNGQEFNVTWTKKDNLWTKLRQSKETPDVWYMYDRDYRLVEAHNLMDHFKVEHVKGEVLKEVFLDKDGDVTFERLWSNATSRGISVLEKDLVTGESTMHNITHYV